MRVSYVLFVISISEVYRKVFSSVNVKQRVHPKKKNTTVGNKQIAKYVPNSTQYKMLYSQISIHKSILGQFLFVLCTAFLVCALFVQPTFATVFLKTFFKLKIFLEYYISCQHPMKNT